MKSSGEIKTSNITGWVKNQLNMLVVVIPAISNANDINISSHVSALIVFQIMATLLARNFVILNKERQACGPQ